MIAKRQNHVRGISHSGQNSIVGAQRGENATQGVHLLKNLRDKAKVVAAQRGITKANHAKRSKQPVQLQMHKQNPEEMQKLNPEDVPMKILMNSKSTGNLVCAEANAISSLTRKAFIEHDNDVIADLQARDSEGSSAQCLKNHAITPLLRAKMVNWMVEVLTTFECENQTFFLAVAIMDSYLLNSKKYHHHIYSIDCWTRMTYIWQELCPCTWPQNMSITVHWEWKWCLRRLLTNVLLLKA